MCISVLPPLPAEDSTKGFWALPTWQDPYPTRAAETSEIQAHLCKDLSGELHPLIPSLALGVYPALLASSAVNQHENK